MNLRQLIHAIIIVILLVSMIILSVQFVIQNKDNRDLQNTIIAYYDGLQVVASSAQAQILLMIDNPTDYTMCQLSEQIISADFNEAELNEIMLIYCEQYYNKRTKDIARNDISSSTILQKLLDCINEYDEMAPISSLPQGIIRTINTIYTKKFEILDQYENTIANNNKRLSSAVEMVYGLQSLNNDYRFVLENLGIDLSSQYSLDTDMITIYVIKGNDLSIINVTDSDVIKDVAASVDYTLWEVMPHERLDVTNTQIYIDFNNETVVTFAENGDNGMVGKHLELEMDENNKLMSHAFDGIGYYRINNAFFDCIIDIVTKLW